MAIATDNLTTFAVPDDGSLASVSFSHTVAGSDRYLLVGIARGYSDNVTTFTTAPAYNGTTMTFIETSGLSGGAQSRIDVYGLIAPATGAHNVTFGCSTGGDGRTGVIARSYTGVDQTTPIGTAVGAVGSSTTVSVAVSSAVNELVSDFIHCESTTTPTVGAGQTSQVNTTTVNSKPYASSDEAGASSVTMSWTCGNLDWAIVAVPLKPVAAPSGTTLYILNSAASSSNYGQLQVGGSAPSTSTTGTGWTVDTVGSSNYSRMAFGSERLSSTFSGTAQPSGAPDNTLGDCFRSTNTMTGDFATGVWTITVPVIAVTAASGQDGRVRVRLWKSSNADGSSATEITSGAVTGTTVTDLTTGAEQTSVATTSSITGFSLANEYLFLQVAWEITGAAT